MSGIKIMGLLLAGLIILDCGYLNKTEAARSKDYDTYIGIQFGSADTSLDGLPDVDLDYGLLQLGVWASEEVSLELRAGTGIGDDTIRGVDLELESLYGMYGLYHYHISELASLYGAVGISRASLKASVPGSSDQDNDWGLSYGVGAKFSIFIIDYMRYLDTSEITVDAVSVGVHYTFE